MAGSLPVRSRALSGHDENLSPTSSSALDRIRSLIDALSSEAWSSDSTSCTHYVEAQCDRLRELHVLLIDSAHRLGRVKDDFRRLGGFAALLNVSKSLSDLFGVDPPVRLCFELLRTTLSVISEALGDNDQNRIFFIARGEPTPWCTLESHLEALQDVLLQQKNEGQHARSFFNALIGFALREHGEYAVPDSQSVQSVLTDTSTRFSPKEAATHLTRRMKRTSASTTAQSSSLWIPEMASTIIRLWRTRTSKVATPSEEDDNITILLLSSYFTLSTLSHYNAVCLHKSGILLPLLRAFFEGALGTRAHNLLLVLLLQLLLMGLDCIDTAHYLFQLALKTSRAQELLAASVSFSREPSHFVFDASLYGHASLELSSICGTFPPRQRDGGYTILAWVRVDEFDDRCHTTLFGAFDASQQCFVLLYLERDTRHLVLQTSVSSDRPSVRFKTVTFKEHKWYHVGLIQQHPRADGSSRTTLLVDGEVRESVRCQYPKQPPTDAQAPSIPTPFGQPDHKAPIQTFLGTPRGLSSRLGAGVLHSRWSLASLQLVLSALPEELIFVYFNVGPDYIGNFQDSLGSFQTYETSTALNLRNEWSNSGVSQESTIGKAIKLKASLVNGEHCFALNVIAGSVTSMDVQRTCLGMNSGKNQTPDLRSLALDVNKQIRNLAAAQLLDTSARFGRLAVAVGGITLLRSLNIDHAAWLACGAVPFALKILEQARADEELEQALVLVFGLIQQDWRNSEAMERENAFSIVAWLLRSRLLARWKAARSTNPVEAVEPLSLKLLRLVLRYTGYTEATLETAVISNPLAYRALIVDTDLWRLAEPSTQCLYYQQFSDITSRSIYAEFNIKRLSRMRVMKKIVQSLKNESVEREAHSSLLQALGQLLKVMPSSEVYRSISLYITFAVSSASEDVHRNLSSKRTQTARQTQIPHPDQNSEHPTNSRAARAQRDTESRPSQYDLGIGVLHMLVELLSEDQSGGLLRKFARTVTSKWVLYLLSTEHADVVVPCVQLICRLIVHHGPAYAAKFEQSSFGFIVLQKKLRQWWHLDTVWTCVILMLFGIDPYYVKPLHRFNTEAILEQLSSRQPETLYCPQMLPVLSTLIETAAGTSKPARQPDAASEMSNESNVRPSTSASSMHSQNDYIPIVCTVCNFLRDAHNMLACFRSHCSESMFVRDSMRALFVHSGLLNFASSPTDGRTVRDILQLDEGVDDAGPSNGLATNSRIRLPARRRQSSFVLVPDSKSLKYMLENGEDKEHLSIIPATQIATERTNESFDALSELLVDIFVDQLLNQKDFTGLGLFFKAPPCGYVSRTEINSRLISQTMQRLQKLLEDDGFVFHKPRTLMNITRFASQSFEALMEGWLVNNTLGLICFCKSFLQYFHRPNVRSMKDVRISSPSINEMLSTLSKASLAYLTSSANNSESAKHLEKLLRLEDWNALICERIESDDSTFEALCCALVRLLPEFPRANLKDLWGLLFHIADQRGDEFTASFLNDSKADNDNTFNNFLQAIRAGYESLDAWLQDNESQIIRIAVHGKNNVLMPYIAQEERVALQSARIRSNRRRERLEQLHLEEITQTHQWTEHQMAEKTWTRNIVNSELYRYHRTIQDQLESFEYHRYHYDKQMETLRTLRFLENGNSQIKWQLDECEGRDRMRLRLAPLTDADEDGYEPRTVKSMRRSTRRQTQPQPRSRGTANEQINQQNVTPSMANQKQGQIQPQRTSQVAEAGSNEDYEVVADQALDEDEEDKNRKVMRSLQRGEQVLDVFNISRIVGLEAHEGLLIIGKNALYIVDGLFQRSDGEVINVSQAPIEERDQYTRILSGHEIDIQAITKSKQEPTRHWPWSAILNFSKRNFLTRAVAVEIFFSDGRSYLLTTAREQERNTLYTGLAKQSGQDPKPPSSDQRDLWRADLLKSSEVTGSRWSQLLTPMISNPMTKRWMKGDISNFHYLMWINTQAGRTFNDLTQYPVFPWVLADYTSNELDLSNPRSFRDLTKPMGCQDIARSEAFRERYAALAEMEEQSPPFHYGTHYSSAMTVTSFLIRLHPFVQSHVLLQGGSFDHANRLFHSVEQAWRSASQEGLSDIRELIPEFFYLPDFLRNVNGYNFGFREGDNEVVNNVKLPPWAKGDPEIFIAKHREALESPYVSQNLHAWIDLIFGFKQRGEAAIEATNVFHYLSYPGAKDLEKISDYHERAATIGIIHNFGQTPIQIFHRPHERREPVKDRDAPLLESIRSLARLRSPIHQLGRRISSLSFSRQLIASSAGTCFTNGAIDVTADWAYPDHSVRFWTADRRKMLGLYEQLHDTAILAAVFASSSIFVTSAEDGTVSVWNAHISPNNVDIHPRATLFGHKTAVPIVAFSKAWSVLLTASTDGVIILRDLHRLERIREIECDSHIRDAHISDNSGHVLLCTDEHIHVYSLNGTLLLRQHLSDAEGGTVTCCNFYQHITNAWFSSEIILSGHQNGIIKIWVVEPGLDGAWSLNLVKTLSIEKPSQEREAAAVTSILAFEQKVWAGDARGQVFEWNAVR